MEGDHLRTLDDARALRCELAGADGWWSSQVRVDTLLCDDRLSVIT